MENNVFSFEELVKQTSISPEDLLAWEKARLLLPVGYNGKSNPFYDEEQLEKIRKIQQLKELGYKTEDIRKIIRKVGFPSTSSANHGKGPQFLTVGNLAEKIGISPRTIKHWEEKGIIEPDMRSQGGFRLYRNSYVFFCELIRDLQLFGYTLEEIKRISDYFRLFMQVKENPEKFSHQEMQDNMNEMLEAIEKLLKKTKLLKGGINRWETLVKRKKKELLLLRENT